MVAIRCASQDYTENVHATRQNHCVTMLEFCVTISKQSRTRTCQTIVSSKARCALTLKADWSVHTRAAIEADDILTAVDFCKVMHCIYFATYYHLPNKVATTFRLVARATKLYTQNYLYVVTTTCFTVGTDESTSALT